MTALALTGPTRLDETGEVRLEALLDKRFLTDAGWDWQTMVLSTNADHPTLGWTVCRVSDCDAIAETAGLCAGCAKRMARAGAVEPPATCAKTWRPGVGLCAVGCARPWESARRPLCAAHDHQQRVVLAVEVEAFLSRPGVVPLAGFGPCSVLACTRLRYSRLSPFCKAHHRRWSHAVGRDPRLNQSRWCRTESAVAESGEVSLRGLPGRVVAELLYGLQRRCAEGVKTHRAVLRPLCDDLRRTQAATINDLPEPTRRQRRDLLRSLVTHCRRGLSSPAAEQAKDVWDLVVFGHRGTLSFTDISQNWPRQVAKRWIAEDLPRRRGTNAANLWQYTLGSMAELSVSLRVQRDDHGAIPARLGRTDIVAFTNRLAFLHQSGQLGTGRRIDILRHTRTVITTARLLGLTRPGQAAAGLPENFSLMNEDVPRRDRGDEPGRALPDEVMRQLCAGLPRLSDLTACGEVRVAIELLIDTGRRPDEVCNLPLDCLHRGSDGKYALVYDNSKCQRRRRELPITDTTAQVILRQQAVVRTRFPHTPPAQLKLLPAMKMNPTGTKAFRTATVNEIHRAWVNTLPPLLIHHGGTPVEFDKTQVFPYAYRHTYAQRHADAGVPVDVLRELLDHDSMDTTKIYYRIGAQRRRDAVDEVAKHQFDRAGRHIWRQAEALLDAEHARHAIGQVAVPYGTCAEPTNVQAGGGACPFRFRCVGCDHFRTDVSYLPDLTAYLHDLLRDRERILAATGLDDWARTEAMPSEQEIRRVKDLIHRVEHHLNELTADQRTAVTEAVAVVRRTRQLVRLGMPTVHTAQPDLRLERA